MMTHRDIIGLWPSQAAFGSAVGVSKNTAQAWHKRNSIPALYWLRVRDGARSIGHDVSLEILCQALVTGKKKCTRNDDLCVEAA
jgi:hypothetical protein